MIAFGALVAAAVPVMLALSAVGATIGIVSLVSQISPVDESIASVILLIGLAVGVDYTMFYLRREREERAAGRSPSEALAIAAATSGRAVLISGLTVMIAMAGMYLTGFIVFESFATGTILVVAIAMLGSLTVLPALLSWLGDRVEKGRVPVIGKRKRSGGESRLWSALLDRVLRHPIASIAVAGGLLVGAHDPRARHAHGVVRAWTRSRRTCPSCRPTTGSRRPSPAARSRPRSSCRPRTSPRRRSRRQSPTCVTQALATGRSHEPYNVDVSKDKQVAKRHVRPRGRRRRRRCRQRPSSSCATPSSRPRSIVSRA